MKKILFFLLVQVFFIQCVSAQNTKLNNFQIQYPQLPLVKLPADWQTYSVFIRSGYVTMEDEETLIRQNLNNFTGYQRVMNDGDIQLTITMKGLDILSREVISEKGENEVRKNFKYEIAYTFPVHIAAVSREGDDILETEVHTLYESEYITFGKNGEYNNETELDNAYELNKAAFWTNFERAKVNRVLRAAQDSLVNNFSTTTKREVIRVALGKGRNLNYADLEKASEDAERAYKMAANGQDMTEDFQQVILVWETALQEKNLTNKKSRINRKIGRWLHYNCSMAYTWMNDFENARRHALEAEVIEPAGLTTFDTKQLKAYIADKERRYFANN